MKRDITYRQDSVFCMPFRFGFHYWVFQVSRKILSGHFFLAKLAFAGVEDNPLMEGTCFCGCGAWVGDFMVTLMLVNQCLPDIPQKQRLRMGINHHSPLNKDAFLKASLSKPDTVYH